MMGKKKGPTIDLLLGIGGPKKDGAEPESDDSDMASDDGDDEELPDGLVEAIGELRELLASDGSTDEEIARAFLNATQSCGE